MADKQSFAQVGGAVGAANVTTTGTTTAGTLKVQWDDSSSSAEVMDLLEKAKLQIIAYYATR